MLTHEYVGEESRVRGVSHNAWAEKGLLQKYVDSIEDDISCEIVTLPFSVNCLFDQVFLIHGHIFT